MMMCHLKSTRWIDFSDLPAVAEDGVNQSSKAEYRIRVVITYADSWAATPHCLSNALGTTRSTSARQFKGQNENRYTVKS
jgi:hypothetical protein